MASRQSGGRAPALAVSRRLRTPREPTGTALDRHEVKCRADAVINGGLNPFDGALT